MADKRKSKKSTATKNNLAWRRWWLRAQTFRAILIGLVAFAANLAALWDHVAALWDHIRPFVDLVT
jgi:hypothetical protein